MTTKQTVAVNWA